MHGCPCEAKWMCGPRQHAWINWPEFLLRNEVMEINAAVYTKLDTYRLKLLKQYLILITGTRCPVLIPILHSDGGWALEYPWWWDCYSLHVVSAAGTLLPRPTSVQILHNLLSKNNYKNVVMNSQVTRFEGKWINSLTFQMIHAIMTWSDVAFGLGYSILGSRQSI